MMQLKILKLFGWHLLFFLLFYELRVTLETQSIEELASWFEFKNLMLNLSSLIVFFFYSLGAYLMLYRYYPKSIPKLLMGLLLVLLLVTATRYLIEEIFFLKVFGFDNYFDGMSALLYVLRNLFYAFLHLSLGCLYFFVQYSVFKERQGQLLLLENKQSELTYLRAQVNPHFLFNTLNNIYSLVYQKSEQALPAIEKLTAILRYSLYEGGEIALEKEIAGIENFIVLEKMRYDFPLDVNFTIEGNVANITIPPFLLLPLVENAFKHGDMKAPLNIYLYGSDQQLKFHVHNHVKRKQKDQIGGIGLENIKKRLGLIYGEKQQFIILQKESSFDVQLEIST